MPTPGKPKQGDKVYIAVYSSMACLTASRPAFTMHQYTIIALCLILATSTVAQIPHNLSFEELTAYLPFVSINTDYILNDTRASEQLASAGDNPVTLFLSLNTPFEQYMAEPPPSAAAARVQTAHITDAALTSDTFQYFQIDGIHPSTSFNGTSFLTTRFNDTTYENVTGGAKIEVFRNETAFYVGTGINFKSRVIIPVCLLPSMAIAQLSYNTGSRIQRWYPPFGRPPYGATLQPQRHSHRAKH